MFLKIPLIDQEFASFLLGSVSLASFDSRINFLELALLLLSRATLFGFKAQEVESCSLLQLVQFKLLRQWGSVNIFLLFFFDFAKTRICFVRSSCCQTIKEFHSPTDDDAHRRTSTPLKQDSQWISFATLRRSLWRHHSLYLRLCSSLPSLRSLRLKRRPRAR